jgi:hypothetical protein
MGFMSSVMRQFNEVIGLFDFGLTRDLSEADFVELYNSSPIFREHYALSFSTVNMLSGRSYLPYQLIIVTKLSRYFLILFFVFNFLFFCFLCIRIYF